MASIILTAAASVAVIAAPFTGGLSLAIVAAAGVAGAFIDQALFGKGQVIKGPKLDETRFRGSAAGTPITRVWGCVRLPGPVFWATRFKQKTKKHKQGKSSGGSTTKTTTYSVSFACSLGEGPIKGVGRIWADNQILDTTNLTMRIYYGTDDQQVDPKILAIEGADFTPAHRGLAYVVFENLQLERFGNHIPQMNFEVCRDVEFEPFVPYAKGPDDSVDDLEYGTTFYDWGRNKAFVVSSAFSWADTVTELYEYDIETLEYVQTHDLTGLSTGALALWGLDPVTGYLVGSHDIPTPVTYYAYVYDPETKSMITDVTHPSQATSVINPNPDTINYTVITHSSGLAAVLSTDHGVLGSHVHEFPGLGVKTSFARPGGSSWAGCFNNGAEGEAWLPWITGSQIDFYRYTIDAIGDVTETNEGGIASTDIHATDTFDGTGLGSIPYYSWIDGALLMFIEMDPGNKNYLVKWHPDTGFDWATSVALFETKSPNRQSIDIRGNRWIHYPPSGTYVYDIDVGSGDVVQDTLSTFDNGADDIESGSGVWHGGNMSDGCLYSWTATSPPVSGFQWWQRHCWGLADSQSIPAKDLIKAIDFIPGYGDFTFATQAVTALKDNNTGEREILSAHSEDGTPDFIASLTAATEVLTKVKRVSMITGWTCDDLRCDTSKIRPRPEVLDPPGKSERPAEYAWIVSDTDRSEADSTITLQADGLPYGGGTPSDRSVKDGIEYVLSQGLDLTFICQLYMDIPPGNTLTNPYDGTSGQDAFPWSGRITLNAAPGQGGSTYKLAGAVTEIGTFFGNEVAIDFGTFASGTVPFSGTPTSWTYRRMVLHYAKLCEQAGMEGTNNVFVIGTDLTGLTHIQDNTAAFPAVDELIALLAEVKKVWTDASKTPPQFTYAAHWTEWNVNHAGDGSGDILFHLDDVWNHADIAGIGINFYAPLSDWRDGTSHLDAATYDSIYSITYLKSQIEGGEEFTYEYTSQANRDSQTRSTIDDPDAADEDWVFRRKDIRGWWLGAHHERPGGTRSGTPNSWTAQSKPIWLMQIGTGAHDKSTNQPDAFFDPDSEDAFAGLAWYSNGTTDSFIQDAYLTAFINYWESTAINPGSSQYSGRMIDVDHIYVAGWDHRPYPLWPTLTDVWGDAERWSLGRWISGRIGGSRLSNIVAELLDSVGVDHDISQISANVVGYYVSATVSVREIINPLAATFFFDAYESEGVIKFRDRGGAPTLTVTEDDMVLREERGDQELHGPIEFLRGQETELPGIVRVNFIGNDPDYSVLPVQAEREFGNSLRVAESRPNIVMDSANGQQVADILMHEAWVSREEAAVSLMPSSLALDASDVVSIDFAGRTIEYRIMRIGAEYIKPTQLVRTDKSLYVSAPTVMISTALKQGTASGIATLEFLDLPLLGVTDEIEHAPWLAVAAFPWPSGIAIYRITGTSFTLDITIPNPSALGTTVTALPIGVHGIFNRGSTLDLDLSVIAELSSTSELDVLSGKNAGALKHSTGAWEVFQWTTATLLAPNQYRLSGLLRGQQGADVDLDASLAIGSRFVLLDESVLQSNMPASLRNAEITWEYGPSSGSPGDPEFEQQVFTPIAVGLRPLMPMRSVARKNYANNDIIFKWIRRTRIDGEIWDNSDVPLGETLERYKILIYNGSTIVRTIVVDDTNTGTYTTAQQTTDSFAVGTSLDWGVLQVSGEFGDGAERKITSTFLA